ncbi:MAG: phosphonoacetaldehyde hydrolase [Tannerellaceae bacterium]|jgi:phosphonoacetaldehyde hydrolase|nr:phosphonoacetaldehyde hydrolase [Tannerellaceae bacterium]
MKKVECIIMDWAGTAVDFGCFAPVGAFMKAFEEKGVRPTDEEIRLPMGKAKVEHIRALLEMERIRSQFAAACHREWNADDVAEINKSFERHLFLTLACYADPIPGVVETMGILREQGIKIGSTTGYTRAMMDIVQPEAAKRGYTVDSCVTPDGLPAGRPAPFMIFRNMINLNVQHPDCVVKVGDTIEDVREGLHAKVHVVGVIMGSSELGLSAGEIEKLPPGELSKRMNAAGDRMLQAGAHHVLDSIEELPLLIHIINSTM